MQNLRVLNDLILTTFGPFFCLTPLSFFYFLKCLKLLHIRSFIQLLKSGMVYPPSVTPAILATTELSGFSQKDFLQNSSGLSGLVGFTVIIYHGGLSENLKHCIHMPQTVPSIYQTLNKYSWNKNRTVGRLLNYHCLDDTFGYQQPFKCYTSTTTIELKVSPFLIIFSF